MAQKPSARRSLARTYERPALARLSDDYLKAILGKANAGHQMVQMGRLTVAESEAEIQAICVISAIMARARCVDITPAKRTRKGGAR